MIRSGLLLDYITSLFVGIGCSYDDARVIAEVLVEAELRGITAHGVRRVANYSMLANLGRINVAPDVRVVYQTPTTATVDGDNCFGPVVAKRAMALAIEKARTTGTGWVAVRGSNHFGVGVYYSKMALENDMVGIVLSNSSPLVAPVNSTSKMLGTNPISVAIPALRYPPLIYDFATAPITRSKLEETAKQGRTIPKGLVQDMMGEGSVDPSTISRGGAILPLGGGEAHGGHKGFCIGSLVDIFSSLFSGANFGPFVPPEVAYLPLSTSQQARGVGHFFGAIRVDAFRPAQEFKASVDTWIETFSNATGKEGTRGVQMAGEGERRLQERSMKLGIRLSAGQIKDINRVAKSLGKELLPYTQDEEEGE